MVDQNIVPAFPGFGVRTPYHPDSRSESCHGQGDALELVAPCSFLIVVFAWVLASVHTGSSQAETPGSSILWMRCHTNCRRCIQLYPRHHTCTMFHHSSPGAASAQTPGEATRSTARISHMSHTTGGMSHTTHWLTRIVLLRGIGTIYFFAFLCSAVQGRAFFGTNGVEAIVAYTASGRRDNHTLQ